MPTPDPDTGQRDPAQLGARLRAITAEHLQLPPSSLVAEASLVDDLGLDSLAAIEWGMVLEDVFGIALPDAAWTEIQTFGQVEQLVSELADGGAAA